MIDNFGSFEKRVGNEEKILIFQYPKINYPLEIQKSPQTQPMFDDRLP